MHFHFIDVLLMYYRHQHISATRVAICSVIFLRTRIHEYKKSRRVQMWLKCLNHSTALKTIPLLV